MVSLQLYNKGFYGAYIAWNCLIEWNILTLNFKRHKKCPLWDNFKIININLLKMSLFLIGMNPLANNQLALTKFEDVKLWYCTWLSDKMTSVVLDSIISYNQRQNELRHFAQNWAFLRFTNFKRRKYSFPPPSPGVWILLFSEITLFKYNVSTILSPIVAQLHWYSWEKMVGNFTSFAKNWR